MEICRASESLQRKTKIDSVIRLPLRHKQSQLVQNSAHGNPLIPGSLQNRPPATPLFPIACCDDNLRLIFRAPSSRRPGVPYRYFALRLFPPHAFIPSLGPLLRLFFAVTFLSPKKPSYRRSHPNS